MTNSILGKNILIGVTAGIAAYKICELVRGYKKQGANVKVLMTENAQKFVSPLVLSCLSENKVYCSQFDYSEYDVEHISLAKWADIFVIAPLTANTISKLANGICDNLLTTVFCAFTKQVLLVPAMNVDMYENNIIQNNLDRLRNSNTTILEPAEGFLACGVTAKGRMPELDVILEETIKIFDKNKKNKKVLLTAGGTKENIDPVRYVGNYSSGKMGIALADEAYKAGFEVVLVSTVAVDKPYQVINVVSADEMFEAVKQEFPTSDYLIMAAAVADFKPINIAEQKIKKSDKDTFVIEMVKNPDILKEMGKIKTDKQVVIGFCAESENLLNNATKKLHEKNIDFIVANDISRSDIGFNSNDNEVTILGNDGSSCILPKMSKMDIAKNIIQKCILDKIKG